MKSSVDIEAMLAERDELEHRRVLLEAEGAQPSDQVIRDIDVRLRELNDQIVAYGKKLPSTSSVDQG